MDERKKVKDNMLGVKCLSCTIFQNRKAQNLGTFLFQIASLNINGLNDDLKQRKLMQYLNEKHIDIALIQEHNIRSNEKLEYLLQYYIVILNRSILSKGGTPILIDKKLPVIYIGQIYILLPK